MVSTTTWIEDSVKFIRDDLGSNITDPISGSRSGRDRFVMTSYPERPVKYPLITVRNNGSSLVRLGMRSSLCQANIVLEVRVWARNEVEKDQLTEQVQNRLRSIQFTTTGTSDFQKLHDFGISSVVPVDESGVEGVKSNVLTVNYFFILGS